MAPKILIPDACFHVQMPGGIISASQFDIIGVFFRYLHNQVSQGLPAFNACTSDSDGIHGIEVLDLPAGVHNLEHRKRVSRGDRHLIFKLFLFYAQAPGIKNLAHYHPGALVHMIGDPNPGFVL